MNHNDYYQPPHNFDDERQFNFPGYIFGQIFGGGQQHGGQFPGQGGNPWGQPQPPGFPGNPGNQFPGPPGGGQSDGAPNTPPPSFTPTKAEFQTFAVDPGAIRGCLYRFTYVWLRRDAFWFYPTYVGRTSVAGFRWNGFRWTYYGIDLDRIESFQCF